MATLYEAGKPRLEALSEAEEAIDLIAWYADEMERSDGFVRRVKAASPQEENISMLKPIGVYAAIAPFNFPVAAPCNMLGACLVAGNTAVFKPSPSSGLTGALLMEAAEAAGLPSGVLNMLCGEEAGSYLADAPGIDGLAFTGSHAVGMKLYRKFASGPFPRPAVCEMSGKNPAYVTAKADLDTAAEGLIRSAFGFQGQKRSACSVLYVEKRIVDNLLDRLKVRAAALIIGSPEGPSVLVGPVIDQAAVERFEKAIKAARAKGRIVHGGRVIKSDVCAKGTFIEPTIIADLPPDHWINREELFLPLLSVQSVASLAAGIAQGNEVAYGLAAGIYSRDKSELETFYRTAEAGVLYANRRSGATTGAWPGHQALCGWKGSGVDGRGSLGPFTISRYMREQSITIMRG